MFARSRVAAPALIRAFSSQQGSYSQGLWKYVEEVPLDSIKIVTEMFKKDPAPVKINLGEGVYKTDEGKPCILPSVREAEKRIFEASLDHEYAPVDGLNNFRTLAAKFAFGESSKAFQEKRIASAQTLSGTGALRLGAEFLYRFVPSSTPVYLPTPSWVNHTAIFKNAGFDVAAYRYFDKASNGLDFNGAMEDIRKAPRRSIVLFHACAHNPTGIDPNMDQWKQFSEVCKERGHIVFFDNAYQGFASGNPEQDAAAFRYFVEQGHEVIVTSSFSKNFGLYGERVGALYVTCNTAAEAQNVESQLRIIIRAMYSNPPVYGARLVSTILGDAGLHKQWLADCKGMADRITTMRSSLVAALAEAGSKRDWSHISRQIGMFAFSGLNQAEVDKLIKEHHVYLTKDGRISISGINSKNVKYLANAFHEVTKQ